MHFGVSLWACIHSNTIVTNGCFVELYAYSIDLWPPTFPFPQDSHRWGRCFGNLNGCPSNGIRKITWDLSGLSSWCLLTAPWYLPDTQYLKSLFLWLSAQLPYSQPCSPAKLVALQWLACPGTAPHRGAEIKSKMATFSDALHLPQTPQIWVYHCKSNIERLESSRKIQHLHWRMHTLGRCHLSCRKCRRGPLHQGVSPFEVWN